MWPDSQHLQDNGRDRRMGARWERNFGCLAGQYGKSFTPHQVGRLIAANAYSYKDAWRLLLLPDFTIWSAPGEHHEIKHKNPTRNGRYYGLEKYRFDALTEFSVETRQTVLYTIHDWELAGATRSDDEMPNDIRHWLTADVIALAEYIRVHKVIPHPMNTWVNGQPTTRPGYYWPTRLWQPLATWWRHWRLL